MIFYIAIFLTILIDFFTKRIALNYLIWEIIILWDYLKLKLVFNSWIAFSIPINWIILKIITILLILWIWYYYQYEKIKKSRLLDFAFALILGWAIWNWVNRIISWNVLDFISVKYFAIFNFADIFISVWVIFIIFHYLQISWKNKK